MSSNWTNYRVDPVFIRTFSLAEENYDHAVFIHPPLFVYSAAVLVRFFALPLPLVPVLMQSIGLLALWLLSREYYVFQKQIMVESNRKLSNKVSFLSDEVIRVFLLTMLIVMTCPLLWLTSQKIWIDNAVFMSVCISTAVHVWMTNTASLKHRGIKYFAAYQCMSGVLFAVFSLNCKITTLALLPCLSMYTVLALSCEVKEVTNKTIMSWMWRSFVSVSMLVVGSVLGYLPWTYHYWVSVSFA